MDCGHLYSASSWRNVRRIRPAVAPAAAPWWHLPQSPRVLAKLRCFNKRRTAVTLKLSVDMSVGNPHRRDPFEIQTKIHRQLDDLKWFHWTIRADELLLMNELFTWKFLRNIFMLPTSSKLVFGHIESSNVLNNCSPSAIDFSFHLQVSRTQGPAVTFTSQVRKVLF